MFDNSIRYDIKQPMKKTRFFQSEERPWVLVDAKDQVLGRIAARVAKMLMGKNKPTYTPNALCGDRVVIINAQHIRVTGNKYKDKIYDKYSGYPSGRKEITFERMMEKNPVKIIEMAIKGMLPKNHLGACMFKSLRVYPQSEHGQAAQKPAKAESKL